MSKQMVQCRRCGKAKKRGAMSRRDRAFCSKCMKRQKAAVKARHADLVKAGIVPAVAKVAKPVLLTKSAKAARVTGALPVPRRAAAVRPLAWDEAIAHDPAARERARAAREQAPHS